MAPNLMTVPKFALRVGGRALGLAYRAGEELVGRAGATGRDDDRRPEPTSAPASPPRSATPRAAGPTPTPPASAVPLPGDPQPEPRAPAPVIEPDELVAEFADPGAEDGAGAELHVAEPWDGYEQMTAGAITDRLVVADAATIAAVQLYEATHRNRSTVVAAAEQRLAEAG